MPKGLRLYKKEKLCSEIAIEQLFEGGVDQFRSLVYPIRVVARTNPRRRSDSPLAFVISVPKKRLRHAVDRVKMRRRIREAYRLHRHDFPMPEGVRIDAAFVYVANGLTLYPDVERAMLRLLGAIQENFTSPGVSPNDVEPETTTP